MKESMWGVFIIIIGAVGIVTLNLFQNITTTNDHVYYLMKETTKAAMGDAVDLSYYRTTGRLRIVEAKFVENLTRRFAESVALNRNYSLVIHDVVEQPPKVSLSIATSVNGINALGMNAEYDIQNTIDSIYEAIYKREDLYKHWDGFDDERVPGYDGEDPEDIYEDGNCPNANSGIDECISGDLQFLGWGDAPSLNDQACSEDLLRLVRENRDATYKECLCGKWSDPTKEVISTAPVVSGGVATYTWTFIKNGPVNDINESVSNTIIGGNCLKELKILIKDDLRGTNSGGIECPDAGIVIFKGQKPTLYPRYIPVDAVNRKLTWSSNNSPVASVWNDNFDPIFPDKDNAYVVGASTGVATITAESDNGHSDTCVINVTTCADVELETGSSKTVAFTSGNLTNFSGLSFSISDISIAGIDRNGLISAYKSGNTKYTITSEGATATCNLTVTAKPTIPVRCPNPQIEMYTNSEADAYLEDTSGKELSGDIATWKYTGSLPGVSISSGGHIKTGATPSNGTNYEATLDSGYRNASNGSNTINCSFKIIEPTGGGGCTVGNITASWGSSNLKTLCQGDITYKTRALRNLLDISVTPALCGFTGFYADCFDGRYSSMGTYNLNDSYLNPSSYSNPFVPGKQIIVSANASSYSITWKLNYKYTLWNPMSYTCDLVKDTYTRSASITRTGTLLSSLGEGKNYLGDKCSDIDGAGLKDTIKFDDGSTIDVKLGATNGIPMTAYATYVDGSPYNDSQIKWYVNGIPVHTGNSYTYQVPKKDYVLPNGKEQEIIIRVVHPNTKDGRIDALKYIKLYPYLDCSSLAIRVVSPFCQNVFGKADVIYGKDRQTYNKAIFYSPSPTNIFETYTSSATTDFSAKATTMSSFDLKADPQVGECASGPIFTTISVEPSKLVCAPFDIRNDYNITGSEYCYYAYVKEAKICPDYYSYAGSNQCKQYTCLGGVRQPDGSCRKTANPSCPTGFATNSTYGCTKAIDTIQQCPSGWTEEYGTYCTKSITTTTKCPEGYTLSGSKCYKSRTYTTTYGDWINGGCKGAATNCNAPKNTSTMQYRCTTVKGCPENAMLQSRTVSGEYTCPSGDSVETLSYIGKVCTTSTRITEDDACPTGSTRTYIAPSNGPWKCNKAKETVNANPAKCSVGRLIYTPGTGNICITDKTKCSEGYSYDSTQKLCISTTKENAIFTGVWEVACPTDSKPFPEGANSTECRKYKSLIPVCQ